MLKRNLGVVLVAGLVLGGAAAAWAGGGSARPTVLAAAQESTPGTPAPGTPAHDTLTPEQRQAKREALRTCLEGAGENRDARRACLEAAGPLARHHKRGNKDGHKAGPGLRGPAGLAHAIHGTLIVPKEGGGFEEVTFDRGEVDAATDESKIVVNRPDGQKVTVALTADTKYHGVDNAAALVDGRRAMVTSRDGKALHVLQKPGDR